MNDDQALETIRHDIKEILDILRGDGADKLGLVTRMVLAEKQLESIHRLKFMAWSAFLSSSGALVVALVVAAFKLGSK